MKLLLATVKNYYRNSPAFAGLSTAFLSIFIFQFLRLFVGTSDDWKIKLLKLIFGSAYLIYMMAWIKQPKKPIS